MAVSTFRRKIASVRVGIASPERIRSWSSCERCGVRVESKEDRRKRMGHIELAAPVVHIWYLKSSPSILSTLLNISVRDLENIVYHGSRRIIERIYIVTDPKKTQFVPGDVLYETEYNIYKEAQDFDVELAVVVRNPKSPVVSDIDGEVKLKSERTITGREITWIHVRNVAKVEMRLYAGMTLLVKDGQDVEKGAEIVPEQQIPPVYAPFDGTVEVDDLSGTITVKPLTTSKEQPFTFAVPFCSRITVKDGQKVKAGDQLITGGMIEAINVPSSGKVVFGKNLNLRPLEDGSFEVLSNGTIYIEQLIEEKRYPIFEGALPYVSDGQNVKKGDHLADRFAFENEILSMSEYRVFEEFYPGMFTVEAEVENDRLIVTVTDIDPEVSKATGLTPGSIITENEYDAYRDIYPGKIQAHYGASAVKELLQKIDLEKTKAEIEAELSTLPKSGGRAMKLLKRLKVVKDLIKSGSRPEWMVLEAVPVIPPELRPMIQIEGGRFATTDLNDLYRRVINRNNRLKRLLELGAPDVIVRSEKRMLQEAVDSLIYNGRVGKSVTDRNGRALKSLTDLVKGKKGRFRRNLLGKRVDYSGRAVIVVGPELKIHQCGLPKKMALELFKPFVLAKLLNEGGEVGKTAKKMKKAVIEREMPEAWDVLEEVIKGHPVLLNRAPTLHRMSIQAFEPKLIEGNAIQLHPLVCPPFNADFDGDQMAVHVPLSAAAQAEARYLMLSRYNITSPAHGRPISMPGKDVIVGVYYLTAVEPNYNDLKLDQIKWHFASEEEAILAYELGYVGIHSPVAVMIKKGGNSALLKTTVGRVIFNMIVPEKLRDYNKTFGKKEIKNLIYETFKLPEKNDIIREAEKKVEIVEEQYQNGFLTYEERFREIIKIWSTATNDVQNVTYTALGNDPFNPVFMMVNSGARGNIDQVKQLAGMRGLMADPSGKTIEIPITSNFREGLSVMEFFISTHGARKGAADTALRTSSAGYLTRRLVDVAQSLVVTTTDCGTEKGIRALELMSDSLTVQKLKDFLFGRVLAKDVVNPLNGETLVNPNTGKEYCRNAMLSDDDAAFLSEFSVSVPVSLEKELDIRTLQKPFCYAEISEEVRQEDGFVYEVGSELTWEVIKAARSLGKETLKVKLYPCVGTESQEVVKDRSGDREIVAYQEVIDETAAKMLESNGVTRVKVRPSIYVRSVLTCESDTGVCALCYGMDLSTHRVVQIGEAVGIVAAQSIGEPGTQLTMRTFHTGGIATTADITQGLPRAEELFEARKKLKEPEGIFCTVTGFVKDIGEMENGKKRIYIEDYSGKIYEYDVPDRTKPKVKVGQKVLPGDPLSSGAIRPRKIMDALGVEATAMYLLREIQRVYVEQGVEINNKHFEIIIRQMLGKVEVTDPGDTDFLPGRLLNAREAEKINEEIMKKNTEVHTNRNIVLGKTLAQKLVMKSEGEDGEEIAPQGAEVTEEMLDKAIKMGIKEVSVLEGDQPVTYQIAPKEPMKYRRRLLRITKASLADSRGHRT